MAQVTPQAQGYTTISLSPEEFRALYHLLGMKGPFPEDFAPLTRITEQMTPVFNTLPRVERFR